MAKTVTTSKSDFSRGAPPSRPGQANDCAIFRMLDDSSRPGVTRITLPSGSTYTPGPHWHERHVEIFKIIQGRVLARLNGNEKIISPTDPAQRIEKFVVHEFMRADVEAAAGEKDIDDVIIEEWTEPADQLKHVFFRNLFSCLEDAERYWKTWTSIQAFLICAKYDNYPVFGPRRLAYWSIHLLFVCVKILSWILRLKPWYEEYTPIVLRKTANVQ